MSSPLHARGSETSEEQHRAVFALSTSVHGLQKYLLGMFQAPYLPPAGHLLGAAPSGVLWSPGQSTVAGAAGWAHLG